MSEQYQLERWTGREYVPHGAAQSLVPHKAAQVGDTARQLGLPAWRVVRVDKDRPRTRPHRWRPVPSRAGRSVDKIRAEYLAWAAAAGVDRVTFYAGPHAAGLMLMAHSAGLSSRTVDPADFLGPAPGPETIEEC